MAHKILNTNGTLTALQANSELGSTGFTPKAGLTWLTGEFRPFFAGAGDLFVYQDDQLIMQVASEDISTYGLPWVAVVQIQQPVVLHLKFTDRSNASNAVGCDFLVDESQTTGA